MMLAPAERRHPPHTSRGHQLDVSPDCASRPHPCRPHAHAATARRRPDACRSLSLAQLLRQCPRICEWRRLGRGLRRLGRGGRWRGLAPAELERDRRRRGGDPRGVGTREREGFERRDIDDDRPIRVRALQPKLNLLVAMARDHDPHRVFAHSALLLSVRAVQRPWVQALMQVRRQLGVAASAAPEIGVLMGDRAGWHS